MTNQAKTLAVVIPGGGDDTSIREVTVVPGTTAQDVLNALGKGSGHILGTISGQVFKPKDLVFSLIADGDKLVMTPSAEAGASAPASPYQGEGFLSRLARWFSPIPATTEDDQQQVRVAQARTPTPAPLTAPGRQRQAPLAARTVASMATPGKTVAIGPRVQTAWQEKGWRQVSAGVYEGKFQSPLGQFNGRVEFSLRHEFQRLYIWGPPAKLWLSGHPKAVCFSQEGGGKCQVHFHHPPTSVDCAILNLERILTEASRMGDRRNG